ncbi:golgin subfamily A member 6-like protein 2 [Passer montanus]|uniref:golgin subfamily A member 6-like protein 2 n=1 Tax=Passer montanus TaxID=9160 RepID=UPI0019608ECC|nr:golgin subfamily A member 6-like protein 2 [Passer montanus]
MAVGKPSGSPGGFRYGSGAGPQRAVGEGCSCPAVQLQRPLRPAACAGGLRGLSRARPGAEVPGGRRGSLSMNGPPAMRVRDGGAGGESAGQGKRRGKEGGKESGAGEKSGGGGGRNWQREKERSTAGEGMRVRGKERSARREGSGGARVGAAGRKERENSEMEEGEEGGWGERHPRGAGARTPPLGGQTGGCAR